MPRGWRISLLAALTAVAACDGGARRLGVTVTPTSAAVVPFATQQFLANVSGTLGKDVTWSITRGPGTIDSSGVYHAPDRIPAPADNDIRVRGSAVTDSAAFMEVVVHIVAPPLNPDRGPDDGGTAVSITGYDFSAGGSVLFGTTSATLDVVNPSLIRVIAPPHAGPGPVDVTLQLPGETVVFPQAFHYAVSRFRFGGVQLASTCAETKQLVVADIDGDGNSDVVVICSGQLQALFGNELGELTSPVSIPLISPALSVATGDFDGTGGRDLYVHESGGSMFADTVQGHPLHEIIRYSAGAFESVASVKDGSIPAGLERIGDMDGDAKGDVVFISPPPNPMLFFYLKISGEAEVQTVGTPIGAGVNDFTLGNFDVADASLDVAVLTTAGFSIFANKNGTISPGAKIPGAGFTWISAGDYNGDGTTDVILSSPDGRVALFAANDVGAFAAPVIVNVPGGVGAHPFVANVDGVVGDEICFPTLGADSTPEIFVLAAHGSFEIPTADTTAFDVGGAAGAQGPVFYALDSGLIEAHSAAALDQFAPPSLNVFPNGHHFQALTAGSSGFFASDLPGAAATGRLAFAPFDLSTATTLAFSVTNAASNAFVVDDFDEDGFADITGILYSTGVTPVPPLFENLSNQSPAPLGSAAAFASTADVVSIASGRLDGDLHSDLVLVTNETTISDRIDLLFGDGTGSFTQPVSIEAGLLISSATVLDVDGDGDAELVVGETGDSTIEIFPFAGGRVPASPVLLAGPVGMTKIVAQDVDGDYIPDLIALGKFAALGYAEVDVIRSEGGLLYDEPVRHIIVGTATGMTVADIDGDSFPDIVVFEKQAVGTGAFVMAILRGKRDGQFAEPEYAFAGSRFGPRLLHAGANGELQIIEPRGSGLVTLPNDSR